MQQSCGRHDLIILINNHKVFAPGIKPILIDFSIGLYFGAIFSGEHLVPKPLSRLDLARFRGQAGGKSAAVAGSCGLTRHDLIPLSRYIIAAAEPQQAC
jgi:hypothetical protein